MSDHESLFPFIPWSKEADFFEAAKRHERMGNWQPIETAPKVDGERILLFTGRDGRWGTLIGKWMAWNDGSGEWYEDDGPGIDNATHWMPLPAPPKDEP